MVGKHWAREIFTIHEEVLTLIFWPIFYLRRILTDKNQSDNLFWKLIRFHVHAYLDDKKREMRLKRWCGKSNGWGRPYLKSRAWGRGQGFCDYSIYIFLIYDKHKLTQYEKILCETLTHFQFWDFKFLWINYLLILWVSKYLSTTFITLLNKNTFKHTSLCTLQRVKHSQSDRCELDTYNKMFMLVLERLEL